MSRFWAVVMIVVLTGCVSGSGTLLAPAPYSPPANYTPRPLPPAQIQESRAQQEQRAVAILERAQAVFDKVDAAVKLDGSPQTIGVANAIRACQAARAVCLKLAGDKGPESKVGALAGLGGLLVSPLGGYVYAHRQGGRLGELKPILDFSSHDLELAEQVADNATKAAQAVADARAGQQQNLNDEMAQIQAATTACTPTKTCASRCNAGDGFACVAAATALWHGRSPKLADAKITMQRGCDVGVQRACASVGQIDEEMQQAVSQIEGLWSAVVQAGDGLAVHHFEAEKEAKLGASARTIQRMLVETQAIADEQFCPARKAFIAATSAAEFSRRAAGNCTNDPPVAEGISGAEVTLPAQCRAAFATPCP